MSLEGGGVGLAKLGCAVHKTQFVQISLLPRDSDFRYVNPTCEVSCTLRRRCYRLSRNLFPNERLRDECSPKAEIECRRVFYYSAPALTLFSVLSLSPGTT